MFTIIFSLQSRSKDKDEIVHSRSCGLAILLNGTSSKRAQEHSTTARPAASTIGLSEGDIGNVPFGLFISEGD